MIFFVLGISLIYFISPDSCFLIKNLLVSFRKAEKMKPLSILEWNRFGKKTKIYLFFLLQGEIGKFEVLQEMPRDAMLDGFSFDDEITFTMDYVVTAITMHFLRQYCFR
jgi:hypothetical protein